MVSKLTLPSVSILFFLTATSCLHLHKRRHSDERAVRATIRNQELNRNDWQSSILPSMKNKDTMVKKFPSEHARSITGQVDVRKPALLGTSWCGTVGKNPHEVGRRWRNMTLTWRIVDYTEQLNENDVHRIITESFEEWSQAIGFSFQEELDPDVPVHIALGFAQGDHGDGDAFDGPEGTLAHAFYPDGTGRKGTLEGDVHYDLDENWNTQNNEFFRYVTLHELGHSLGLIHSRNPAALMFYRYLRGFPRVTDADKRAIQEYYGLPTPPSTTKPSTVTVKPTPDNSPSTAGSVPTVHPTFGSTHTTPYSTVPSAGTSLRNFCVTRVLITSFISLYFVHVFDSNMPV